ncbi:MAG: PTS beta-glucoside transporter subunit IIABC, partial [Alphaproteobacteria bacterium]
VFNMTFPASLAISYLVLGPQKTKQLVRALVNDFLQTIFVFLVVLVLIVWAIWHFLTPLFGG